MGLISSFVFVLGLAVGSFLNAVIYRLEKGESALHGRSYCPHCKHILAWQDLIPVVSFMMLRGKCRYCRQRISVQCPLVETATAALFLLIFNFQFSIFNEFSNFLIFETMYLFTIASLLIVLFVYDLKHYILPDKILFPAIGLVFGYHLFVLVIKNWNLFGIWSASWRMEFGISAPLTQALLSAVGAAGFFFLIFFISRGAAMGFGDVKLAFLMGLMLGFPQILVALFVAFLLGAIIGVVLIALRKKGLKSEVPFGPFLVTGTFIAFLWGESMVQWYWNNFLV